ncbi:MAG: hypothetical protein ACON4T_03225 [Synechococcus sp.]
MSDVAAQMLSTTVVVYAATRIVFALAFVTCGARRLSPDALHGTWGFRVLFLPDSAALWPWLAER